MKPLNLNSLPMVPILRWTPGLGEYLETILPERIQPLLIEQKGKIFASTDISSFEAAQFRHSVPVQTIESRQNLIFSIDIIFDNYELLIDDANGLHSDSIVSRRDSTQYQRVKPRTSKIELMKRILDCESWRSVGLIFSVDMTSFGIYTGAFDDEGYILIIFDCTGKDDIIDIYQTTFC